MRGPAACRFCGRTIWLGTLMVPVPPPGMGREPETAWLAEDEPRWPCPDTPHKRDGNHSPQLPPRMKPIQPPREGSA